MAWTRLFQKFPTTCLLGPANAGKTSYFLNEVTVPVRDKAIVTVVPLENILPLDSSASTKPNVAFYNLTKDDDAADTTTAANAVLIDEVHLFTAMSLSAAVRLIERIEPQHVYIAALTGSFRQHPFDITSTVIAMSNQIISIPGICCRCSSQTSRSGLITNIEVGADDVCVGKGNFGPECFKCCHNI